jgi:hypothetical protein
MDVQINQAGADDFAFGIKSFCSGWRRKFFADGGNFAVEDEHIGDGVKLVGGVHYTAAGEKQRIHPGERIAARLTWQACAV